MRDILNSELSNGLLAAGIYSLAGLLVRRFSHLLTKTHPRLRQVLHFVFAFSVILVNLFLYKYTGALFPVFSTILLMVAICVYWKELNQFWQIGLIGADREIRTGIDYKRSLEMCSNSLSFLGVGARKLTENPTEFEGALQRCNRPNRPIRFLLCNPASELLVNAAKSAGEAEDTYQHRVTESLRVIARLRNDRAWNIQVRFYQVDRPLFRLMFIDEWLCLASHYVFGEGDGSAWPQLHVRRSVAPRDVNSLYHPFEQYFEELWAKGHAWNFEEFIEE